MDESGNRQQPFGNGPQVNEHPRPFFYVQPPSQPYYLYQHWQLNNPYSHYGLPAGFNLARPCMLPYQYMQHPGFVYPHAPIYPLDYRRMFEPRFHVAPPCGDMPYYQQQHHFQGPRETACSEAQTDPSNAISKLIECLDKIRASELQQEAVRDRELDSGIASQSSAIFSPEEEKKTEEQGDIPPSTPHRSHLETAVVTYRESREVAYESSQRVSSPERSWSARLEEEPPIDSSSLHEDCPELEQSEEDELFSHFEEKEAGADVELDVSLTESSVPKCDAEESTPSPLSSSGQARSSDGVSRAELLTASLDETESDRSYQILKLPLDSILTPGSAGAAYLPPPDAPYYYNLLSMQKTYERMSVLSPSLDELSSRDEMFSTDLDDMDIFPKHMYAGRRLPEVVDGPPHQQEKEQGVEEWLAGSKRVMCACCGKRPARGRSQSKAHGHKVHRDDLEEESRYGTRCDQPVRVVTRRYTLTRRPHSDLVRHGARPWYKRGSEPGAQEEARDVCRQEAADGEAAETASGELQCRTCRDGHCREELPMVDQSWRSRRRPAVASPQRRETSGQWKVMHHRLRDEDHDDDEPPAGHWERVSTMRGDSR